MRNAVLAALALVAGGLLAHLLLADPGYVAIRGGGWLFETTLPVFLLVLAATYVLTWTIGRIVLGRSRLATLRSYRRRRRARDDTQRGTLQLARGNWKTAEELLTRAAPDADSPVANYLVAARAADLLDATERRDEWLARAQEAAPDERAAVLITLAEMQMRRGQDAAALHTLEQLDASGDLNSRGLELMARLYRKLGQGQKLLGLESRLRAAKEIPEQQVNELLAQAAVEEIRALGERGDWTAVEKAWSALPRSVRKLPYSITAHARAAMACNQHAIAEKALRDLLGSTPDDVATRLYGDLVLPEALLPLERAEALLRRRPEDPELLAACARLSLRAELFGKARSYLETSLAIRPNTENSLLLAELLDQMGEHARAAAVLRDALTRSVGRRSNLPRVRIRRR